MARPIINIQKLTKMKAVNITKNLIGASGLLLMLMTSQLVIAQDSAAVTETVASKPKPKPVKNTFEGIWLIDNQTFFVPVKGTFEMDIMHRFGTLETGYEDFYGFFAPSNIRLGVGYVPVNKLMVGLSITKQNMTWEGYLKYSIITQTKNKYPVSVSYYANMAVDTRGSENFYHNSDRLSYFHQIMIARKISDKLSIQVSPSLTHVNVVNGYFKTSGSPADSTYKSELAGEMEHNHFAIAVSARYKIKPAMNLLFGYDQPLTKHATNNPNPNLSLGIEFTTSAHSFQLFVTNFYNITPQRNNYTNKNNPITFVSFNDITFYPQHFLIGFNITRLWNY
jgi:uncharacterized beta barrel domain-containing protein DUF5777